MNLSHKTLAGLLYGSAVLVAFIFTIFFLVDSRSLHTQVYTTDIIYKSTLLRVKTEHVAHLAYNVRYGAKNYKDEKSHDTRLELWFAAQDLLQLHISLTDKQDNYGVRKDFVKTVRDIYLKPPYHLESETESYIKTAVALANVEKPNSPEGIELYEKLEKQAHGSLANAIDALLAAFNEEELLDKKARERSNYLHFGVSIIALVMGVILVLRPLLRTLEANLEAAELLSEAATLSNEVPYLDELARKLMPHVCSGLGFAVADLRVWREGEGYVSMKGWTSAQQEAYPAFCCDKPPLKGDEGGLAKMLVSKAPFSARWGQPGLSESENALMSAMQLGALHYYPVVVHEQVAAVLELIGPRGLEISKGTEALLLSICAQISCALERQTSRAQSDLMEKVLASAGDAIMVSTVPDDHTQAHVIYINDAYVQLCGYAREDVLESQMLTRPELSHDATLLEELRQAMAAGQGFRREVEYKHSSGTTTWVETLAVPVRNHQGKMTHLATFQRDITQRRRAEKIYADGMQQLRRANLRAEMAAQQLAEGLEAAEAANKAKSDFLANMSHELRTPMNGVLGMTHLLADTPLNKEQQEFLEAINGSAETLLMLLNDILDLSKIEAGALELEHQPVALQDVVRETSRLLQPLAVKKGIDLQVDYAADLPPLIWGDPGRLRQIITNLLGNAIKFTERGYVRLVCERQAQAEGADQIILRVEDTGIGIAPDKLDNIFNKFTQADTSITRKYGGTGLGLAITRQLALMMQGTIRAESALGHGSTFCVTLPCQPAEAADAEAMPGTGSGIAPETMARRPVGEAHVLLVEDYPVNQVFATKLLNKVGFKQIDLAVNGQEAVEMATAMAYDFIFMDCQMPVLDGYQASTKLREMGMRTPIVAMTANAMVGDREKCLRAGMDEYLSKPLRPERLRQVISRWFILPEAVPVAGAAPVTVNVAHAPALDLAQLRNFTDGDRAEELALAALFREQAEEVLQLLEAEINAADGTVWKSLAHRLKGASGNLGAERLSHICKRAEASSTGTSADKAALFDSMRAAYRDVVTELEKL